MITKKEVEDALPVTLGEYHRITKQERREVYVPGYQGQADSEIRVYYICSCGKECDDKNAAIYHVTGVEQTFGGV